ncbi:hypothetical protein [Nocardia sp. NPDC050717]
MRTSSIVVFGICAAVLAIVGASAVYWIIWAVVVCLATGLWIVRR